MSKPRSQKFWIIFWSASAAFLIAWTIFWQIEERGIGIIAPAIDFLPVGKSQKNDYATLLKLADYVQKKDGQTRTFMVLFQNNMEIRPGGGYLGTFGIVKIKNGHVLDMETHDLSNYDKTVKSDLSPPYPLGDILHLDSWKLRDSNFSPDFSVNARKIEEIYQMGSGQENFDGIIAVNSDVLTSLLKVTGPVELLDFPGEYNSENAILALEYQVEQGYVQQGIEKEDRKSVISALAETLIEKVYGFTVKQKIELAGLILKDLKTKEIQLYFKDKELEEALKASGWAGLVDRSWNRDYLMMVDANIGAWKSDYYIKRNFEYSVDLTKEQPVANLKITYTHGGKVKDWMTKNYLSYLRVYVPDESWFVEGTNFSDPRFGNELGKKYFGALVWVPLGQSKTIELSYRLPAAFQNVPYDLLVQKQSGINDLPGQITIIQKDGKTLKKEITIDRDWKLSES